MRARLILCGAAAFVAMTPGYVAAQSRCSVQMARNATAQGGSESRMTVQNTGDSCGATLFRRPETQEPTASLAVATPPAHGTVVITQPNRFDYTPAQGFAGSDRFVVIGQPAPFRVTMTVTVVPPPPRRSR